MIPQLLLNKSKFLETVQYYYSTLIMENSSTILIENITVLLQYTSTLIIEITQV